mgnify:CR=1 FL=1
MGSLLEGRRGRVSPRYTPRPMPPILNTWPYAAVFWLVFLWAYWPADPGWPGALARPPGRRTRARCASSLRRCSPAWPLPSPWPTGVRRSRRSQAPRTSVLGGRRRGRCGEPASSSLLPYAGRSFTGAVVSPAASGDRRDRRLPSGPASVLHGGRADDHRHGTGAGEIGPD